MPRSLVLINKSAFMYIKFHLAFVKVQQSMKMKHPIVCAYCVDLACTMYRKDNWWWSGYSPQQIMTIIIMYVAMQNTPNFQHFPVVDHSLYYTHTP